MQSELEKYMSNKVEDDTQKFCEGLASKYGLMDLVALGVGSVNPAFGLFVFVASLLAESKATGKTLEETRMPDEWLAKVAASDSVSDKGLQFLSKKVQEKGYVTAQDAKEWLVIEKKCIEKEKAKREKNQKTPLSPGAEAILKRTGEEKDDTALGDITAAIEDITVTAKKIFEDVSGLAGKVGDILKR